MDPHPPMGVTHAAITGVHKNPRKVAEHCAGLCVRPEPGGSRSLPQTRLILRKSRQTPVSVFTIVPRGTIGDGRYNFARRNHPEASSKIVPRGTIWTGRPGNRFAWRLRMCAPYFRNCSTWNNCVGGYRCWRGFAKNSYCFRCDLGADAIVGLTGISHRNLLQFLSLDPCKFEGFVAALRHAGTWGGPQGSPSTPRTKTR